MQKVNKSNKKVMFIYNEMSIIFQIINHTHLLFFYVLIKSYAHAEVFLF